MRFLKRKILAVITRKGFAPEVLEDETPEETPFSSLLLTPKKPKQNRRARTTKNSKKKKQSSMRREELANKNIIKNFGRAIANFAASNLAAPYISLSDISSHIDLKTFIQYCLSLREYIQNFETFKEVLVACPDDSEERKQFKRLFRILAEVFIKYFSINWIFHGKMLYKREYIASRGAILKRIRAPEKFSGLEFIKMSEKINEEI